MIAIQPNRKTRLETQDTFQDPAVPMVALPTRFTSHRVNRDQRLPEGGSIDIANLKGTGCVRHIWILFAQGVCLEINVDGAKKSQVDLPLKAFFGIMHDWEPYFVDNAAYTVLPNPEAKAKDPLIPGNPGYNFFCPFHFVNPAKSPYTSLPGTQLQLWLIGTNTSKKHHSLPTVYMLITISTSLHPHEGILLKWQT